MLLFPATLFTVLGSYLYADDGMMCGFMLLPIFSGFIEFKLSFFGFVFLFPLFLFLCPLYFFFFSFFPSLFFFHKDQVRKPLHLVSALLICSSISLHLSLNYEENQNWNHGFILLLGCVLTLQYFSSSRTAA